MELRNMVANRYRTLPHQISLCLLLVTSITFLLLVIVKIVKINR